MLDHLEALVGVLAGGQACAAATVIRTSGSVPRPAGTSMLVTETGAVSGSLSGGCVEAAVLETALAAIADGRTRTETFGFSETEAFAVGLSCGGTLEVLVQPFHPEGDSRALPSAGPTPLTGPRLGSGFGTGAGDREASALIRLLPAGESGHGGPPRILVLPEPVGEPAETGLLLRRRLPELLPAGLKPGPDAAARITDQLLSALDRGQTGTVQVPGDGCGGAPLDFLIECRLPAPHLFLVGANDFSAALCRLGLLLGYRVSICDARPAFTDPARFPGARQVAVQWPDRWLRGRALAGELDRRSVVCVLSHDARFDVPVLAFVLRQDLAYVGALGSRRSHEARVAGLRAAGSTDAQLAKLHSPIGLDIGAVTPDEVALSILAEIVAVRTGACTGLPLSAVAGPIHARDRRPDSPRSAAEGVRLGSEHRYGPDSYRRTGPVAAR